MANRHALTGDHIDAAEALRIGLVNEVKCRATSFFRVRAHSARALPWFRRRPCG